MIYRLNDDIDLTEMKKTFNIKLGQNIGIDSWEDLNKSLFEAMRLEKIGATIVLSLIFFVSSFNLAMNLSLNSIQNLKEIALIRALGASKLTIRKIIIFMGLKLSGIGILYWDTVGGIIIIFFKVFINLYQYRPLYIL